MTSSHPHIRPVDARRDLNQVADLIETCFVGQMDADGRQYVRQIRRMAERANNPLFVGLTSEASVPIRGLVWEENGTAIANLTLIPFFKDLRPVYLVANVAVHPAYRRRGIGHQLTQHAVNTVLEMGAGAVWLHVRDDNPVAIHLYESLGFVERARRTTWTLERLSFVPPAGPADVRVTTRRGGDWKQQLAWLRQTYPPEVAWNLPFNPNTLSPNFWRRFMHWLNGEDIRQLAARRGDELLGVAAHEPTPAHSDLIWLACDPQHEDAALRALLPVLRQGQRVRPLLINYPAGRATQALDDEGFEVRNTLIWMEFRR